jgi:hypothetical protein
VGQEGDSSVTRTFAIGVGVGLLLGTAACSPGAVAPPPRPAVRAPAVRLTATLADPAEIDLRWPADVPAAAGYFIEYANGPRDAFVVLDAVPPTTSTFRHTNLAPETTFLYVVRPYFAERAADAEIVTATHGSVSRSDAGPSELLVRALSPTSVELRWADRAKNEDGYLVERTGNPGKASKVVAILSPDATSYVLSDLPAGTRCGVRVRPFSYGAPSNVAEQTTGSRPG